MDGDFEFVVWRIRQLRSLVLGVGLIALVSLALSLYAALRAAQTPAPQGSLHSPSPRKTSSPDTIHVPSVPSPAAGKRSLKAAMAAAASAIELNMGHDIGLYYYQRLLASGYPIALGGSDSFIAFSRTFAAQLGDDEREEWLTLCLEVIKDVRLDPDRTKKRYAGTLFEYAVSSHISGCLSPDAIAAVYNLSKNDNLRSEAKALWDADARNAYAAGVEFQRRLRPETILRTRRQPTIEQIPDWP